MHEEITMGGFGGQGVLFIGRLLAEAAFREGHEVVWMPSYGAEKRGGTVWCDVIVSDEVIGALFTTHPTAAVAMNPASLAKLEPMVRCGGLLVVNQSLVPEKVRRTDIRAIYIPANDLASGLGNDAVSNLIMLGALLAGCPVVAMSGISTTMGEMLSKNKECLAMNEQALGKGYHWTREYFDLPENKREEDACVQ